MNTTALRSTHELLEPPAFVWTNAGSHVGETLVDIVNRKRLDIEKFGWCLWAYAGGGGPAHPETQVRELARRARAECLAVVMPDTGKVDPLGAPFSGYSSSRGGRVTQLPAGMSPVTGASGAWALLLDELGWASDMAIDVVAYEAPFAAAGPKPLTQYLKGSHGRACAIRSSGGGGSCIRPIAVIGRTKSPHAVYLAA